MKVECCVLREAEASLDILHLDQDCSIIRQARGVSLIDVHLSQCLLVDLDLDLGLDLDVLVLRIL